MGALLTTLHLRQDKTKTVSRDETSELVLNKTTGIGGTFGRASRYYTQNVSGDSNLNASNKDFKPEEYKAATAKSKSPMRQKTEPPADTPKTLRQQISEYEQEFKLLLTKVESLISTLPENPCSKTRDAVVSCLAKSHNEGPFDQCSQVMHEYHKCVTDNKDFYISMFKNECEARKALLVPESVNQEDEETTGSATNVSPNETVCKDDLCALDTVQLNTKPSDDKPPEEKKEPVELTSPPDMESTPLIDVSIRKDDSGDDPPSSSSPSPPAIPSIGPMTLGHENPQTVEATDSANTAGEQPLPEVHVTGNVKDNI